MNESQKDLLILDLILQIALASLIAQLVKNPLAMQGPCFVSWVGKIPWRRDSLPTPIFLGFPCGSAGKESTCNAGDLGLTPGLGRSPWRRERLPTPVFWPGEFHGLYSLWSRKESDMNEQLSLSSHPFLFNFFSQTM